MAPLQDPNYSAVTLAFEQFSLSTLECGECNVFRFWMFAGFHVLSLGNGFQLRNQALAAHFALASWFGFVAQGDDPTDLLRALAADISRQVVELSFTGCRGFADDALQQLLKHLPRRRT